MADGMIPVRLPLSSRPALFLSGVSDMHDSTLVYRVLKSGDRSHGPKLGHTGGLFTGWDKLRRCFEGVSRRSRQPEIGQTDNL